jgi:Peptidase M66
MLCSSRLQVLCAVTLGSAALGCSESAASTCSVDCSDMVGGVGASGSAAGSAGSGGAPGGAGSPAVAGTATGGANGNAGSASGGASGADGASGASGARQGPLPPSYQAREYAVPEPKDGATCSGAANDSAVLEHVAFAQTHVLEPEWPFFFLVAQRPALLEVAVTGSGAAPEVRAEAFRDGASLGAVCLAGPTSLPSSVTWAEHEASDRYRATLPAAWLEKGLSVTLTAGAATKTFSAEQLAVGAAPELNLIMLPVDVLNYNDGQPDVEVPEDWLEDFAGALPVARVRLGQFPGRVKLTPFVVSDDAESGIPPTRLERRPCRQNEAAGASCVESDIPAMNISAAALRMVEAIHRATGDFAYTHYYGNTEHFNPGGWGGGKDFVGADFDDIFIHEMGHALSLPHWGEGAYQNTDPGPSEFRYPYGGATTDGGGRGEMWNYYQNTAQYASPLCRDPASDAFGQERSDAMQRNHACVEWRGGERGRWDGYGDFSALAAFRFMTGAEERTGSVPYRGGMAPFHLSRQSGYPNIVMDEQGQRSLVRREQASEESDEERYDFLQPQAWDTPVATVYGTYHPSVAEASLLYAPIEYRGPLPQVIDPTEPETFARLLDPDGPYDDYFYWAKDLCVRVTYQDGEELVALLVSANAPRDATLGSGPWRSDLTYFAVNVPRSQPIRRVELFRRPFLVRGEGSTEPGNIRNPSLGITAATFMKDAQAVTSWQAP